MLVDDDASVLSGLTRTLRRHEPAWQVTSFACPQAAWEHLRAAGADTVISDLRMPHLDGLGLLALAQSNEFTKDIPFIVLTGLGDQELRRKALDRGATDLLSKPADTDDLLARVRSALRLKSYQDELKQSNASLEQTVARRTRELRQSRLQVVWRLAKAAEFRDEDTGNHVIRVASYSRAIAESLGLARDFVESLFVTAPLHDVGKIAIPDAILRKPGKLTTEEFEIMQGHCAIGARILRDDSKATAVFQDWWGAGEPAGDCEDPLLEMAARIALAHHEKWNGAGYPNGLASEAIPLEARIVAVADVYDALTSERPYKPAFSSERSWSIIREGVGQHFDPDVYAAFAAAAEEIEAIQSAFVDRHTPLLEKEEHHEVCAVCG
jgi:putative two-component system response regulator